MSRRSGRSNGSDIGVGAPPPLPADILQQAVDAAGLPDYDADDDDGAGYVDPGLLAAMGNWGAVQVPTGVGTAATTTTAAAATATPVRTVTARTLPTRVGTATATTTTTRATVGRKRPRRRLSRRLHRRATRATRSQTPQRHPTLPRRATRSHTPQRRMRMGSSATSDTDSGASGRPIRMNQPRMQRQLEMLLQDQQQTARGRRIAGITNTKTITTTHKDGGRPSVRRTLTRVSGLDGSCLAECKEGVARGPRQPKP